MPADPERVEAKRLEGGRLLGIRRRGQQAEGDRQKIGHLTN
jgi:hypothetical protein